MFIVGVSDHLCGSKGRLLMLFVDSDESSSGSGRGFTGMKLEVLGECSTPHCLAYLDNGVVFVGSRLGDSQLVKVKITVTGSMVVHRQDWGMARYS